MRQDRSKLKIAVLEDNTFYNKLLSNQIESFAKQLAEEKNCDVEVLSYTDVDDFLNDLDYTMDAVILDYYLGKGFTALDVIKKIRLYAKCCKVAVMSQAQNVFTSLHTLKLGASGFISKSDKYAIPRACFFVEDAMRSKLTPKFI